MEFLSDIFGFVFFQRALLVGIVMGSFCALLGNFIVLRKEANITHSLANVMLLGILIALLVQTEMYTVMICVAILSSMSIVLLQKIPSLSRDSSLEIIAQLSMASIIVLIQFLTNYQVRIETYLFGDILAISQKEVWGTVIGSLILLVPLIFFRRKFLQVLFHEDLARSIGTHVSSIHFLFVLCTAVTIGLSIKIVGLLVLAAFFILPSNIAKLLAKSFHHMMLFSIGISILGTVFGIIMSFILDIPTGATIVLCLGILLFVAILLQKIKRT